MPKPNYNITSIAHATTHDYMDDQKGLIQSGKTAACDIITHRLPRSHSPDDRPRQTPDLRSVT